jgi:hypothetical protein
MKSRLPTSRSELIGRSLHCLSSGLLGLIPVLGIPFAARAWVEFLRLRRPPGQLWNPASAYLIWGVSLACVGLLLTLLVGLWVVLIATHA